MKHVFVLLAMASLACSPGVLLESDSGTSVGNPTKTRTRVGVNLAPVQDFEHTHTTFPLDEVALTTCAGSSSFWEPGDAIDLLDGPMLTDPPIGAWCKQKYEASENVVIEGDYKGTPYRFEFEQPTVVLWGTWAVLGDDDYILEIGTSNFLNAYSGSLANGYAIEITPEHPHHDGMRSYFEGSSALFRDADGDGVLSDDERANWLLAKGMHYRD